MIVNGARERWSSRLGFILVAVGAAAGLGNIWKFPYIVGEHGGGAFVLVYLLAIAVIGVPVLIAELLLGRSGNHNVVDCFAGLARAAGRSPRWSFVGWIALVTVFVGLSFYSVVGGWALAYLHLALTDPSAAQGKTPQQVVEQFGALLADPGRMALWHTVFMGLSAWIVASGVRAGIERAALLLMPVLFVLLLVMTVYAAVTTQHLPTALTFLFAPDLSKLSATGALTAVGHAFFTLSVGAGAMATFGSYLPRTVGLAGAALSIAALDTLVAMLAVLIIFPIVFANGIDLGTGPGLVFVALPIAFAEMSGGAFAGICFFALLVVAAITSAPAFLETMAEYLREHASVSKRSAAIGAATLVWLLGLAQTLSFSTWSVYTLCGKNLFDLSDFLVSAILLPAGGMLIAFFAGWVVPRSIATSADGIPNRMLFQTWRFSVRYIAPIGILLVLISGLA